MKPPPDQLEGARLERDFLLRLLELGEREDLPPFLDGALSLILEITQASKGYLELHDSQRGPTPRFWMAKGFTTSEVEQVRRDISTGIIAASLATGRTIATANAVEDPRFCDQESVKSLRLQAVLCAPIGARSPIGVLYLEGRGAAFSSEGRSFAELFARHLAPLADRLLVREEQATLADHTLPYREKLHVTAIAGSSRALAEVFRQIGIAAPVPVSVLITGESGTGKTLIARAIHDSSPRAQGPFVEVNCTAIPETLFESELFGAEKGAHSTATQRREGKVDAARGGTLLLDEVGDIPLALQGKLLMFLQSRKYYRLGSATQLEADVRVVAATNASLEELVAAKRFREDLYYRLNVLQVRVPALRERREDIVHVARALAASIGARHGAALELTRSAVVALEEGEWPGNVRQLENVVHRGWATALSEASPRIEPHHLFPESAQPDRDTDSYDQAMRAFQARFLQRALDDGGWNVSETARRIGLSRSHLNELIKAHGLATHRGRA